MLRITRMDDDISPRAVPKMAEIIDEKKPRNQVDEGRELLHHEVTFLEIVPRRRTHVAFA